MKVLANNSALPPVVHRSSRGGSAVDAWRDDNDEDEDDQEPIEEVMA